MVSSTTVAAAVLLAIIAAIAGAVYMFGVPTDLKRDLERKAIISIGENQAGSLVKEAIHRLPEDDRLSKQDLKRDIANEVDADLQKRLD